MENKKSKICLNCKGNWDECKGYECICLDGVCCDIYLSNEDQKKRLLDREHMAFGYVIVKD